ncbi:MAG TPA: NADH-quinone oxidoreductase subunit J [Deinococcales bacterium]|nr:NADH-quinone oxidoreductase subunit J [Deinococcales bacterium]
MNAVSINPLAFWLISIVVVFAAIYSVSGSKLLNAALALALSFFAIGGLYALLGAPFLAVLQVLVNAGAIPIVTVFIIMMTQSRTVSLGSRSLWYYLAALAALVVVAVRYVPLMDSFARNRGVALTTASPAPTKNIGTLLLSSPVTNGVPGTLFAFEMASAILLVAMIGAIILAKREGETIKGHVGVLAEVENSVREGEQVRRDTLAGEREVVHS